MRLAAAVFCLFFLLPVFSAHALTMEEVNSFRMSSGLPPLSGNPENDTLLVQLECANGVMASCTLMQVLLGGVPNMAGAHNAQQNYQCQQCRRQAADCRSSRGYISSPLTGMAMDQTCNDFDRTCDRICGGY